MYSSSIKSLMRGQECDSAPMAAGELAPTDGFREALLPLVRGPSLMLRSPPDTRARDTQHIGGPGITN
jgi:hypothetical protein